MKTDLIKLLDNEQNEYTVKLTKKTLIFDLLLIYITIVLSDTYRETILSFILMFIFFILVFKLLNDIRQIFFDRIYITNKRIIMQKGLIFKRIMIIHLSKVLYVSHKRGLLDKFFKTGKVRFSTTDQMTFKFKGLKHWDHVVNLLYKFGKKSV